MGAPLESSTTSEPLAPPVEILPNEMLLKIFSVIAQRQPRYDPTTVEVDYPGFAVSQVSRRWRMVAYMCHDFWGRLAINLPGFSPGQRNPASAVPLLALALKQCRFNVELTVTSNSRHLGGPMQDKLCKWLARNPNAVKTLKMEGRGAAHTLAALFNALHGQRLTYLKIFHLDVDRYDFRRTASNRVVRHVTGILQARSHLLTVCLSLNQPCPNDEHGRRASGRKIPAFMELPNPASSMLSNLGTMTIVNSPALLSFAQTARLTVLSVTCSTACLSGELMVQLAGVLHASHESLTTLCLHGWMCWSDETLLNGLRELQKLETFDFDFYITQSMVTDERLQGYSVAYVDGVVACWERSCQIPSMVSMRADCICSDGTNLVSRDDVRYIFDRMEQAWSKSGSNAEALYCID